jgi:hypothetical protein
VGRRRDRAPFQAERVQQQTEHYDGFGALIQFRALFDATLRRSVAVSAQKASLLGRWVADAGDMRSLNAFI